MAFTTLTLDQLRTLAPSNGEAKIYRAPSERFWVNVVDKDHSPALKSELHEREADIYVIVEGEADLYLGGVMRDPVQTAPGQLRGSGIDGATVHPLRPGDLIIIPENVPHMVDARTSRVVYAVIKEQVG